MILNLHRQGGRARELWCSARQRWADFSPGIALRLGVAFAAVAILALAANMLVDGGVRVVQRTLAPPPAVSASPNVETIRAAPEPSAETGHVDVARALRSLVQFDRALQNSLTASDPALGATLTEARATLADTVARTWNSVRVDASLQRRLRVALDAYLDNADRQLAAREARRAGFADYRGNLDVLRKQAAAKLDKAWKVFGRVVARQSLVDLRDSLEQLHDRAVRVADAKDADNAIWLDELLIAEELAQRRLDILARQRGEDWVAGARQRFGQMAVAREKALASASELASAKDRHPVLRADVERLLEELPGLAPPQPGAEKIALAPLQPERVRSEVPGPLRPRNSAIAAFDWIAPGATPFSMEQSGDLAAVVDAPSNAPHNDALLFWVSIAVLLLIFGISLATVRSVAGQVTRLQNASRRIAAGDPVHVPNGGIRELDFLAASFNEMSKVLQGARTSALRYQKDLESRVEERTRALSHQARHDPLTDLPNRRALFSYVGNAIAAAADRGHVVGMLLLDLDNFKDLNDSMGHGFGDQVLVAMARRLSEWCESSGAVAARLGGDEFTVVLPVASDVREVQVGGEDLMRAFQCPLRVGDYELILGLSVGVSVCPVHADGPDDLLRAADAALFQAKALGRSQLAVFTPDLLDAVSARFATEQGLRRAMERGEFQLLFQPEVDSRSFEVEAVEALLRWRLPSGDLAVPADFLKVAEESGLITEISDWVLREGIAAAARWHHGAWPEVRVAINVSSRQMIHAGFVGRVTELLAQYRLPPGCIEIELTETVLQTGAATVRALEGLRALGVSVALDDFGTGYSSLTSLEQLPLSRVKLDRSLIEELDSRPRSRAIVDAIVRMCHGLDLKVTAEGIERPPQLAALPSQRALLLQGYLFSCPVAFAELTALRRHLPQLGEALLLESPQSGRTVKAEPGSRKRIALPAS